MTNVALRTIERSVRITATPEVVWQYWVDPERMCAWWGAAAQLEPEPGGRCRVEMAQGPVMEGRYIELVPHERIVFTFGWEGNAPGTPLAPGSTRVEITLKPDGDETILTLRHTDMPASHASDHEQGWAQFLAALADTAGAGR